MQRHSLYRSELKTDIENHFISLIEVDLNKLYA